MRMNAMVVALRFLCVTCAALLWLSSVTDVQAQNVAAGAPITAADVSALRTSVEAADPTGCASVFRWTDDPLVPGQTPIKADHIVELRRAINEIAQGQCPTLLEQVTLEAVSYRNATSGRNYAAGYVLNSGSTPITGSSLNVRVRFFDGNGNSIAEGVNFLRNDDNTCCIQTLGVQRRRPFWVEFGDSAIQGWSHFQVIAFQADGRSVLCSACNRRHDRQPEQVTFEAVSYRNATSGRNYAAGYVLNSGSTPITGSSLNVRVRFFDGNGNSIAEGVNFLRNDDNTC